MGDPLSMRELLEEALRQLADVGVGGPQGMHATPSRELSQHSFITKARAALAAPQEARGEPKRLTFEQLSDMLFETIGFEQMSKEQLMRWVYHKMSGETFTPHVAQPAAPQATEPWGWCIATDQPDKMWLYRCKEYAVHEAEGAEVFAVYRAPPAGGEEVLMVLREIAHCARHEGDRWRMASLLTHLDQLDARRAKGNP